MLHTEETKRKISEVRKGQHHTEATKQKISLSQRGRQRGEKHWNWKGGKRLSSSGYVLTWKPNHPRAYRNKGYVFEHILVIEKRLGRFLKDEEIIHHKNERKDDNQDANLQIHNRGSHMWLHRRMNQERAINCP